MFKLSVELPYYGNVWVEELTNRQLFTIVKYCVAGDVEGFSNYINETIFSRLPPLNIIDKFYLLLFLRSFYVGDILELSIKHEKVKYMEFYMDTILEKIESLPKIENKQVKIDQFAVELGLPSSLYFKSGELIVYDCVKSLHIGGDTFDISKLSEQDKDNVLSLLPPKLSVNIQDFFNYVVAKITKVELIKGYPQYELEEVIVKPISNDPLYFAMSLFTQDMSAFLNFMYMFVNKVGGTFNDFFDLTFNDSKIIFDFYREEMIKQNESVNGNKNQPVE